MDKTYQPDSIEQAWYRSWEEAGRARFRFYRDRGFQIQSHRL